MERMSGIDPMFIYSETPATPMEVAYACVLNPATASDGYSFESVRHVLSERLPDLAPFRRRLMAVPLGLDHPRWVNDPEFDLDNHLHRAAVPEPGGEGEFTDMVAAIMGRPLCPGQPPWEMHVIEGLAGGKVGLVAKVHHSAIDGVAGAQLLAQLLDLTAEGRRTTETCRPWTPPALPSSTRLITDAVPKFFTSPIRTLRALREVGRTAVRIARRAVDSESGPLSIPLFAPDTLNAPVVPDRVVAFAELDLAAINEIRQRFGVTINDAVLAICSGALRRHLTAHEQEAVSPLVAIVPVSVRGPEGDDALGNRLSAMFVPLANDLEDPAERLRAIAGSSAMTKAQERAIGYGPMASALADSVPPAVSPPLILRRYAPGRPAALPGRQSHGFQRARASFRSTSPACASKRSIRSVRSSTGWRSTSPCRATTDRCMSASTPAPPSCHTCPPWPPPWSKSSRRSWTQPPRRPPRLSALPTSGPASWRTAPSVGRR